MKGLMALALTSLEKIGLEFFPQKNSKNLSIFSPKIRGFLWGQTCSVGTSSHPSNHPWKKIWVCSQEYWILKWNVQKKRYFLFYECAIYRIKSKVAYLGQFFADLDEIWYKSRATQVVLTHQISSWSDEKWQRYGTCSVSQGRRGPSNWVSKMNLLKAGGHSFWPRKLIFGYVVAQCIYPKSYYYLLLIKSSVWPWQGPKDNQSVPKYRVRL